MFKMFKRPAAPAAQPQRPAGRAQPSALPEAPPVGDVVEGNLESDWALWENSVFQIDSQLQPLEPSASVKDRTAPSSQFDALDPFSSVGRNRP